MKRLIALITAALIIIPVGAASFNVSINSSDAYEGYTLFVPLNGQTGDAGETEVYLVDMEGEVVHTWEYGNKNQNFAWLEPDGTLWMRTEAPARAGEVGADPKIIQMDEDGDVLWELSYENFHHDFAILPNGNVVLIAWEQLNAENSQYFPDQVEWTDKLVEIDATTMEEVWTWSAQEEMDFSKFKVSGKENEVLHANAVDYIHENPFTNEPALIVSYRNIDTVMMIEHSTGDILWEWTEGLDGQHDPTYLENGNILIYNNGKRSSSVIEVDPLENEIVWSYEAEGFHSQFISGAQGLANGNIFITEGATGRLFEVTEAGEIVWELTPFEDHPNIFRAYRYAADEISWLGEEEPEDEPKVEDEPFIKDRPLGGEAPESFVLHYVGGAFIGLMLLLAIGFRVFRK